MLFFSEVVISQKTVPPCVLTQLNLLFPLSWLQKTLLVSGFSNSGLTRALSLLFPGTPSGYTDMLGSYLQGHTDSQRLLLSSHQWSYPCPGPFGLAPTCAHLLQVNPKELVLA